MSLKPSVQLHIWDLRSIIRLSVAQVTNTPAIVVIQI